MDKALGLPGTPAAQIYFYGTSLLGSNRNDRALMVFKKNSQEHPDEPFWTGVGLARGYTAVGDKPNAIKNWELALAHVPDSLQANVPSFEKALLALKEGK